MLFILAGSFQSIVDNNQEHNPSGFIKSFDDKSYFEKYENYIEKSGLKKELLGRVGTIVILNKLEENDYRRILLESKESPIQKFRKMLKEVGANDYTPSEDEIENIVQTALKSPYGARTLNKMVSELYEDKLFNIHPENANSKQSHIKRFEERLLAMINEESD